MIARQTQIFENAGEAHAVKQPEREHDRNAPGLETLRRQILDRNVRDRQRDRRLDDARRHGDHTINRQAERDRVRDRERRHLREYRLHSRRQQKEAEDEEDVIETVGNDVRESEDEVLSDDVEARRRNDSRKNEGFACRIAFNPLRDRCLSLVREGDRVGCVGLRIPPSHRFSVGRNVAG